MTLTEAQQWLSKRVEHGAPCPCCTQYAKIYKRKLNSGMARSLIVMYRRAGTNWLYIPTEVGSRSREEGKLVCWQLVQEADQSRDDGGRAGWWRLTNHGVWFVTGRIKVPSHARIYNGRCLGLTGELVSIRDCLGKRFNYDELMSI